MFLLPLQLWHAAVPVTEIEMPPRMVVGDAWSSPTLQDVPGRVDLEAALRGDGVALADAHLVFLDHPGDDANRLARQASEVARWLQLADGSERLSSETRRGKSSTCSALKVGQTPLKDPEIRLYSPPAAESSVLVQQAFSQTPVFAMGTTSTGQGAVYAALSPGDQITLVQAFSPDGQFGELIRMDRGSVSVQLMRDDNEASLCTFIDN
jgi:hypothetical protein